MKARKKIGVPKPEKRKRARKPKSSKWKLTKLADQMWAGVVKQPGFCRRCGRVKGVIQLHAAHIKPKGEFRNHHLRCDPKNGVPLCYFCHMHFAHKNPIDFVDWLDREFPGLTDYLRAEAQLHTKFDPIEAIQELEPLWLKK